MTKLNMITILLFNYAILLASVNVCYGWCDLHSRSSEFETCITPTSKDYEVNYDLGIDDNNAANNKINGGIEAVKGEAPWTVALFDMTYPKPKFFCGGIIVTHNWVLTSAKCVQAYTMFDIVAVFGDHNLNVDEETEQQAVVSKILIHPDYDPYTYENDIALIQVTPDACLNNWIKKVNLIKDNTSYVGENCKIFGWGSQEAAGDLSPYLQIGFVTVYSDKKCQNTYGTQFHNGMICVGNTTASGNVGPCQGDWGGPLICQHNKLVGIASWSSGCGLKEYPAIYTSAAPYYKWITSNVDLKEHFECN